MSKAGPIDPELVPDDVRRPGPAAAIAVVAAGGALGAVMRAFVGALAGAPRGSWPWHTLFVNLSGALAIGAVMVLLLSRFPQARLARLFLVTGVLGGYTTFSALAVEAVLVARADQPELAAGYMAATVGGACFLCWLGAAAARAVLARSGQLLPPMP